MKPRRFLKVGDIEPFQCPDRIALHLVMMRRGQIARAAGRPANNHNNSAARLIMDGHDDNARRAADPFERARTFLQSRNFVIYAAPVEGGPKGKFIIRGRDGFHGRRAIIAIARSKGWK